MTSVEWAVVDHSKQAVISIVTSTMSRADLEDRYCTKDGKQTVELLDSVPLAWCEKYEYWDKRP